MLELELEVDLLLKTAVEQTENWVAMTTTRTAKPSELDLLSVPIWFRFVSVCLFVCLSVCLFDDLNQLFFFSSNLLTDDDMTARRFERLQSFYIEFCQSVFFCVFCFFCILCVNQKLAWLFSCALVWQVSRKKSIRFDFSFIRSIH